MSETTWLKERLDAIEHKLDTALQQHNQCKLDVQTRLIQLEQTDKSRSFWTRAAIGAAISAVVSTLWTILRKG